MAGGRGGQRRWEASEGVWGVGIKGGRGFFLWGTPAAKAVGGDVSFGRGS